MRFVIILTLLFFGCSISFNDKQVDDNKQLTHSAQYIVKHNKKIFLRDMNPYTEMEKNIIDSLNTWIKGETLPKAITNLFLGCQISQDNFYAHGNHPSYRSRILDNVYNVNVLKEIIERDDPILDQTINEIKTDFITLQKGISNLPLIDNNKDTLYTIVVYPDTIFIEECKNKIEKLDYSFRGLTRIRLKEILEN